MADPFESSRRKIARAKEHFTDLERQINSFYARQAYARIVEPDPDESGYNIHKVRLIEEFPPSFADIVGDLVGCLRAALDQACYAVAAADGKITPKFTAFPFAGSICGLANALGRSKDVPNQIQSLLCGFQPCNGGDDLLWSLNEICNGDKHVMLTPIGTAIFRGPLRVEGRGVLWRMPVEHVWDRSNNELILVSIGPGEPGDSINYDFKFSFFVAFNKIGTVDGYPVLGVLDTLTSKVERIVMGIEAECRRLKIIP